MGNVEISRKNEYNYLGINVSQNGFRKAKTNKKFRRNQWFGKLGNVVKQRQDRSPGDKSLGDKNRGDKSPRRQKPQMKKAPGIAILGAFPN